MVYGIMPSYVSGAVADRLVDSDDGQREVIKLQGLITRTFEQEGRRLVKGVITGCERDSHGTRMKPSAVADFLRQWNEHGIKLINNHLRPVSDAVGIARDFGDGGTYIAREDVYDEITGEKIAIPGDMICMFRLFDESDALDNPSFRSNVEEADRIWQDLTATRMYDKLKPKQYGFSVEGWMSDIELTREGPVIGKLDLVAVALVTKPSYEHAHARLATRGRHAVCKALGWDPRKAGLPRLSSATEESENRRDAAGMAFERAETEAFAKMSESGSDPTAILADYESAFEKLKRDKIEELKTRAATPTPEEDNMPSIVKRGVKEQLANVAAILAAIADNFDDEEPPAPDGAMLTEAAEAPPPPAEDEEEKKKMELAAAARAAGDAATETAEEKKNRDENTFQQLIRACEVAIDRKIVPAIKKQDERITALESSSSERIEMVERQLGILTGFANETSGGAFMTAVQSEQVARQPATESRLEGQSQTPAGQTPLQNSVQQEAGEAAAALSGTNVFRQHGGTHLDLTALRLNGLGGRFNGQEIRQ